MSGRKFDCNVVFGISRFGKHQPDGGVSHLEKRLNTKTSMRDCNRTHDTQQHGWNCVYRPPCGYAPIAESHSHGAQLPVGYGGFCRGLGCASCGKVSWFADETTQQRKSTTRVCHDQRKSRDSKHVECSLLGMTLRAEFLTQSSTNANA